MNNPRTASVQGFGRAKNFRALAYLAGQAWSGKVDGDTLVVDIPPTVSDSQAISFMWHAFNFPQVLGGWVVITAARNAAADRELAAKMRASVLKFADILEAEGSFVSARTFRELADLPDDSMVTLRKALDHVQA